MPLWSTTVLDPRYRWQLALFSSWGQRMDWIRVINIFWLVLQTFLFSYFILLGCHPPHWLIFFKRGRYTTNQYSLLYWRWFFLISLQKSTSEATENLRIKQIQEFWAACPWVDAEKLKTWEIWGKYHFYHAGKTFRHHFFLGFLYTRKMSLNFVISVSVSP